MGWQLFDRIGAWVKQLGAYRHENLFTDQSNLLRIMAGGEFLDFSNQHSLLQQTNLQINRLERYKDFDQMDEVGEITLALDMYADEASLIDPETKHTLMVRASNVRVKEELEELFYNTLMIDDWLRPAIRYLCKYGDLPAEIVPDHNREGVAQLRHMNVYNFTRVETKYGDLVGFFYQDELVNEPTFFHPWQIMHTRLTSFEQIYHPYGRSILDGARKHFKQLRLMEDAALVYRITRAPEKRVFTIPVGNIPAKDVPQYIQLIAREFKKKKFFDPASGDVNERWHPLIQEDDFWMPERADGVGPKVDVLPGAQNLDEIADIEYFKKKMVSALKIPFSRVGIGEADASTSGEPLYKVSPEFSKAVHYIQKAMTTALSKVAIVHLVLRGYNADDIRNFDLTMTTASAIDELYRMDTWRQRVDMMEGMKNLELFPDEWILRRFTEMTDDEIDQMMDEKEEKEQEAIEAGEQLGLAAGGMGDELGGGIGGLPPLEGLDADLAKNVLKEYNELIQETKIQKRRRRRNRYKKPIRFKNYFERMLGEEELAKLPYIIDDVNGNEKTVIIESCIEEANRKDQIGETRKLLMEDNANILNESVEDEISESDLPG